MFPSAAALARQLGVTPSVITGWHRNGYVPAKRQAAVIDAGHRLGVKIGPEDFFEKVGE